MCLIVQATQHTGVGGLGSSFACLDVLVDKAKASDITTDLFFSANKARTYYMTCLDVPACADTALQMVMSVYGAGRTRAAGAISAKALKVCSCSNINHHENLLIKQIRKVYVKALYKLFECSLPIFQAKN